MSEKNNSLKSIFNRTALNAASVGLFATLAFKNAVEGNYPWVALQGAIALWDVYDLYKTYKQVKVLDKQASVSPAP